MFYDPNGGACRGRDEIDRIAGVIKATHPDFQYRPIAPPEELGDGGRVRWVSGSLGKAPAYAGLTSSSSGTAGLPPFISFSTSYPELLVSISRASYCAAKGSSIITALIRIHIRKAH